MNSLPQTVTARWFAQPQDYQVLREHWRDLLHSERRCQLNSAHHLSFPALLGKDWRRAFTPPSNPRQLANGAFSGWALFGALARLHSTGRRSDCWSRSMAG